MSSTPTPAPKPQADVGVDDIVPVIPPVSATDQAALFNALETERLNREALQQFIDGRGHWDTRIFVIMAGWLIVVIGCVVLQGFRLLGFHLSDAVLIAFITTTTVNVIGLGYIVAKFFFSNPT